VKFFRTFFLILSISVFSDGTQIARNPNPLDFIITDSEIEFRFMETFPESITESGRISFIEKDGDFIHDDDNIYLCLTGRHRILTGIIIRSRLYETISGLKVGMGIAEVNNIFRNVIRFSEKIEGVKYYLKHNTSEPVWGIYFLHNTREVLEIHFSVDLE
jgi:hypothetical protein